MADALTLDGLRRAASDLWRELPPGAVVWLRGELGTGKTTFVRELTRAAGAEPARSPTYALIHEYAAPSGRLVHVDCYRLRSPDEAADLELERLARDSRLTLIEWPDRAGAWAPDPTVVLTFAHDIVPDRRRLVRA